MDNVKLRPWTEWHARSREWIAGIKVSITFDELARFLGRRILRKPNKPNPTPNSKNHD